MIELVYADGSRSSDFRFESFRIERIKEQPDGLPGAYKEEEQEGSSLVIVLRDQKSRTVLELVYSVFEECDCITRFARVRNEGEEPVRILRLMSTQLDVRTDGQQKILSFSGEWAREMEPVETILSASRFTVESGGGTSSNKANPFIILEKQNFPKPMDSVMDLTCFILETTRKHWRSAGMEGHVSFPGSIQNFWKSSCSL